LSEKSVHCSSNKGWVSRLKPSQLIQSCLMSIPATIQTVLIALLAGALGFQLSTYVQPTLAGPLPSSSASPHTQTKRRGSAGSSSSSSEGSTDQESEDEDEMEAAGASLDKIQVGIHEEMKLVLVVNDSLKMTKGKIAAQAGHATLACYETLFKTNPAVSG
jgi:PTH2 family peptidyl-tRNA hydrolase